ncbi:endolytic transglycosylase MltG [Allobacillus sp. GCM10007491]|uniref:endolytic transglycosylase MltG n=1 Tax=Allobacillus TaxID=1400133 RepID=UPI001F4144A1|nr:endolytic transglycosylase MltG [Allobacillus saliphilus]
MKRMVMAYSVGLLTATFIFGLIYWMEVNSNEVKDFSNVPESEIQTYIEEQELKLLPQDEYTNLVDKNKELKAQLKALKKESSTSDDSASSNEKDVFHYVLEIEQGMNSSDIADSLERNKIINDRKPFIDYLAEHDLSQTIQLGSYEIDSSMSIEEIAKLITR